MALSLKLRDTSTFSHENGVKVVVYGRAGVGKTSLCASCPSPVIFSAESGLMSLRHLQLPYYPINTMADVREVYNWARSSNEAMQFQTVCLDSVSDIAETVLDAHKVGSPKDPRQAYGKYNDEFLKLLKDFRDLPRKNVYMSAKQDRITSPEGITLNGVGMPGKTMAQAISYIPDLLLQLDVDPVSGQRFLRTRPDFANDAKDRSGVLAPMEEPHLGKLFAKITGRAA
jgi:hypothetical protein